MPRGSSDIRGAARLREDTLTRTEVTIRHLKEELSSLFDTIGQGVEELRATAGVNPSPPTIPPPDADNVPRARQDLEPVVAAIVRAELEALLPKLVKELVDKQFRGLTEALQARMQQSGTPLQKLRAGSSRIRR